MTINWFTVIAQLINFFVLVALLKRFLYKPILNAISEREKKIKGELEEASGKVIEAEREKSEFRQKNLDFDMKKNEEWEKAEREIKNEKQQQFDRVRQEAHDLKIRLQESMREEQESMHLHLQKKIHEEVFAVASKTLKDLAGLSIEQSIFKSFINKLNSLTENEIGKLNPAFTKSDEPAEVKSAFGLTTEQQDILNDALKKIIKSETDVVFAEDPSLISGLVISRNGYKVAWSISDYISSLENIAGKDHSNAASAQTES